jgi:hypothetical protein
MTMEQTDYSEVIVAANDLAEKNMALARRMRDRFEKTDGALMDAEAKNVLLEADAERAAEWIARLEARIDDLTEALQWCSGAAEFQPGGESRKEWERYIQPLLPVVEDDPSG